MCTLSENIEIPLINASNEKHVQRWKCHRECKSLSTLDINVMLAFRLAFDEPFRKYINMCMFVMMSVLVYSSTLQKSSTMNLKVAQLYLIRSSIELLY